MFYHPIWPFRDWIRLDRMVWGDSIATCSSPRGAGIRGKTCVFRSLSVAGVKVVSYSCSFLCVMRHSTSCCSSWRNDHRIAEPLTNGAGVGHDGVRGDFNYVREEAKGGENLHPGRIMLFLVGCRLISLAAVMMIFFVFGCSSPGVFSLALGAVCANIPRTQYLR